MSFKITVSVPDAANLTDKSIEDELAVAGWLTPLESEKFVPAALAAAKDLIAALPGSGFTVTISGADQSTDAGETTVLDVHIESRFTEPVEPVEVPEPVKDDAKPVYLVDAPTAPDVEPVADPAFGPTGKTFAQPGAEAPRTLAEGSDPPAS